MSRDEYEYTPRKHATIPAECIEGIQKIGLKRFSHISRIPESTLYSCLKNAVCRKKTLEKIQATLEQERRKGAL